MEKTHQTARPDPVASEVEPDDGILVGTRSASLQEHDGFDLFEVLASLGGTEGRASIFQYVAGIGIIQAEAVILHRQAFLQGATLDALATRLAWLLGLSRADTAELLGVSVRTVRRQIPPSRDVLDRTLMASEVFGAVMDVLGPDGARTWLSTPNRALGDQAPVTLMRSRVGERRVRQVIAALLDGAYL